MRMYVEVSSRNTRSVFLVDHCRQNYDTSGNNVCGHRSSFRTMTLRETFLKFYTTIPCDLHKAMSDQVRNKNNGQGKQCSWFKQIGERRYHLLKHVSASKFFHQIRKQYLIVGAAGTSQWQGKMASSASDTCNACG